MNLPEYPSYIELSKNALKQNISMIRKLTGSKPLFASVVKGNAYGHGINEFVPIAEEMGINFFATYDDYEAYLVWKVFSKRENRLMVMGNVTAEAIPWLIENDVEFYVFDMNRLNKSIKAATKLKKKAKIHIEVETGLNRTGFNRNEFSGLFEALKKNKDKLVMKGLCTHYAGAENISNFIRINEQIKEYKSISKKFKENEVHPERKHTACSAAVLNYPQTIFDMVRIGILQYGFWPSKETEVTNHLSRSKKNIKFKRIISWKSRVMAVKVINAGEYAGYGTSYLAEKKIKAAIIPVGYAHGFNRSFSNIGRVLIRGKRLSVIGLVNMNCIIVDITNSPEIEIGDEVVLIGKQGKLEITVSSFSDLTRLMNYELLTRLPKDIPRRVID